MASSSTTIASETIWPTGLDVAAVAGEGKYLYEKKMAQAFKAFAQNFRVSGLAIPGSSANLNITIALGEAVISGFYCEVPATQVAAFASVTNHVFLKLTRDGSNKVTGAQYEVNDTGTAPADSLKIGTLTANGAAITATTPSGRTGRVFRRMPLVQVFTANGNFTVPEDVTEVFVETFAGGGGGGGGDGGRSSGLGSGLTGARGAPGGYAAAVISVNPGSVYAVAVGAGGSGGAAGAGGTPGGNPGGDGGTGGPSTFAAAVGATGGSGGAHGGTFNEGAPGVGTVGDMLRSGHGAVGGLPGQGGAGGGEFENGYSGTAGAAGASGSVIIWY